MKSPLGQSAAHMRNRQAFTLIELLAVMAIILVLAGLILNIAGSAQYNSAKARATGEVKAFETALENYKSDNGAYPPDPFTPTDGTQPTGLLDPQKDFDPSVSKYLLNSQYLYQVLSGFPANVAGMKLTAPTNPNAMTKAYMSFTVQQLKAVTSGTTVTTSSPNMYLIDPFGFAYGYSTIYAAMTAYNSSQNNTNAVTVGYNPTFDLWSTAGYATGGKVMPSPSTGTSDAANHSNLWIKNW